MGAFNTVTDRGRLDDHDEARSVVGGLRIDPAASKSRAKQTTGPPTPSPSPGGILETFVLDTQVVNAVKRQHSTISQWIEVWDYTGGLRFRGFVADQAVHDPSSSNNKDNTNAALFIFFDRAVMRNKDLKHGLMALLELASNPEFGCCGRLVVCLDRRAGGIGGKDEGEIRSDGDDNDDDDVVADLTRDLGWVGFELVTLDGWTTDAGCTSDSWLFLSMDV